MTASGAGREAARTAVVTGGAKGIGRAIALRLARDGYDIAVLDVGAMEEVAAGVERSGRRVVTITTDVGEPDQVDAAAERVAQTFGTAAVLVNNAGIFPRDSVMDLDWDAWNRVLSVNLGGTFLCSKAFGGRMLRAGGGAIVNLASGRALQGAARGSHYAASKGGIISFTRSLAQEWAPTVRVNVVIPGLTDTDQPLASGTSAEDLRARAQQQIPLGRIGQPDDVAGVVAFLVGPDAAYITGASVCVNGGSIMS